MKINGVYRVVLCWGCWIIFSFPLYGQGIRAFSFIDQPTFASLAGLGGINLTSENDPLMFTSNPALLDTAHSHSLSLHYLNFPGGIDVATLGYQIAGPVDGVIGFGLQFFNYGEFEGYDNTGFPLGNFSANEFALTVGYGKKQGVFRYGVNLKVLGSVLESYQAYSLIVDMGINYVHPEKDLTLGITAKNIGFVAKTYLEGQALNLPSDIRLGMSYKAEYMPIRFHLSLRNLLQEDFQVADPNLQMREHGLVDRLFRKIVIGTEIVAHEAFQLRMGYNYLIRKEYATVGSQGLGGFTGGLVFRAENFEFSYSHMFYRVAGGVNLIGITTNLDRLRKF